MSTRALLADLEAAGVHLTRVGDDLRYETRPGVPIAPYRERILANKPALLSILGNDVQPAASALVRGRVHRGPVEATVPPPGWDGTRCSECRWPELCRVLGPRDASLPGGPCPAYRTAYSLRETHLAHRLN
jgi:hypothetical protein